MRASSPSWSNLLLLLVAGVLHSGSIAADAEVIAAAPEPPQPEGQPRVFPPPLDEVDIRLLQTSGELFVLSRDRGLLLFSRGPMGALSLRSTVPVRGIPAHLLRQDNLLYAWLDDAELPPALPGALHEAPVGNTEGRGLLLVVDVTRVDAPVVRDQVPVNSGAASVAVINGVVCMHVDTSIHAYARDARGALAFVEAVIPDASADGTVAFTDNLVVVAGTDAERGVPSVQVFRPEPDGHLRSEGFTGVGTGPLLPGGLSVQGTLARTLARSAAGHLEFSEVDLSETPPRVVISADVPVAHNGIQSARLGLNVAWLLDFRGETIVPLDLSNAAAPAVLPAQTDPQARFTPQLMGDDRLAVLSRNAPEPQLRVLALDAGSVVTQALTLPELPPGAGTLDAEDGPLHVMADSPRVVVTWSRWDPARDASGVVDVVDVLATGPVHKGRLANVKAVSHVRGWDADRVLLASPRFIHVVSAANGTDERHMLRVPTWSVASLDDGRLAVLTGDREGGQVSVIIQSADPLDLRVQGEIALRAQFASLFARGTDVFVLGAEPFSTFTLDGRPTWRATLQSIDFSNVAEPAPRVSALQLPGPAYHFEPGATSSELQRALRVGDALVVLQDNRAPASVRYGSGCGCGTTPPTRTGGPHLDAQVVDLRTPEKLEFRTVNVDPGMAVTSMRAAGTTLLLTLSDTSTVKALDVRDVTAPLVREVGRLEEGNAVLARDGSAVFLTVPGDTVGAMDGSVARVLLGEGLAASGSSEISQVIRERDAATAGRIFLLGAANGGPQAMTDSRTLVTADFADDGTVTTFSSPGAWGARSVTALDAHHAVMRTDGEGFIVHVDDDGNAVLELSFLSDAQTEQIVVRDTHALIPTGAGGVVVFRLDHP